MKSLKKILNQEIQYEANISYQNAILEKFYNKEPITDK